MVFTAINRTHDPVAERLHYVIWRDIILYYQQNINE